MVQADSFPELNLLHHQRYIPFRTSPCHRDIFWNFRIIRANSSGSRNKASQNDAVLRSVHAGGDSPLFKTNQVLRRIKEAGGESDRVLLERHRDSVGILDLNGRRADMFFSPAGARIARDHMVSAALLAPFLPGFNACQLHAAAVVHRGKSLVFLAPDEGGKTTASLLTPSGIILGDDQVIVRRMEEGFRVFGTPWGRYTDARPGVPPAGVFILKKSDRFRLEPMPGREIISFIWREIGHTLSMLPHTLKQKAFDLICDMAAALPTWELSFPRNYIDWAAVEGAVTGGHF